MTFTEWFVCRGRISRQIWWLRYTLPIAGLAILAALADASLGYPVFSVAPDQGVVEYQGGPVSTAISLLTVVPRSARRWPGCTTGGTRRGGCCGSCCPLVGVLLLFVQNGFLRGDGGPNRYGPSTGQHLPTYA